jgi:serine/threonine protein kinase
MSVRQRNHIASVTLSVETTTTTVPISPTNRSKARGVNRRRQTNGRSTSQSPRSSPTDATGTNGGSNPYQYVPTQTFQSSHIWTCITTIFMKRPKYTRWSIAALLQVSTIFTFIFIASIFIQQKVYRYTMWIQNDSSSIFLRKVLFDSSEQTTSHQYATTTLLYTPRIMYSTRGNTWQRHRQDGRMISLGRQIDTLETFMSHNDQLLMVDRGDSWEPPHQHCVPKAAWQIESNPNCNMIHEINFVAASADQSSHQDHPEDSLLVLGEGWFRTTWRLDRVMPHTTSENKETKAQPESVVLKTLRIAREFLSEYYELHRRDAVAMERLTASPFVVNVFGYCGQSAINELADFPFPGVQNLETFNRRMRGKESAYTNAIKLRMAASIALGVADIHAGGSTDPDDMNVYMTHYDLNPRNIALFTGGRPKINDFNIAEFLRYDPGTEDNATCEFPSRLHEPWWRAPEEMNMTHTVLVDERVDIYALGNILYHTLTSHSSQGKQTRDRMNSVRPIVAAGIKTKIPEHYANSKDPNVIAIIQAIDKCWAKDPLERATAEDIAMGLYDALLNATDMSSIAAAIDENAAGPQPPTTKESTDDDAPDEGDFEDKDAMGHDVVTAAAV